MTAASRPKLSLVIPAFNEEHRIGKSLEQVLSFLATQSYPYEIVVVDDGSTDKTVELVRNIFAGRKSLQLVRQSRRRGKGAAVRKGMLQAHGDYLFFSDADLSVPIDVLPAFISRLEHQWDAVIGSRRMAGASVEVHQPPLRELMGRVFTLLSNTLLGLHFSDVTCGFKGFHRSVARELFARQRLYNWSFDSEILYLAARKGYRVAEVPVTWRNDKATKVRLWKDAIASFLGLLAIRSNHLFGRYRLNEYPELDTEGLPG